ncbi:MAG: rhomboid family intramembrane serine protease [Lachnospiraceae bacterium]|nr:rhomboid family intramembrane serine protease [Lachnospiraceae bacterium]
MKKKVISWVKNNLTAIILVVMFIPIFIWTQNNEDAVRNIGTTSMEYLNNEFYRWFTCIFYHYSYDHIIFNSLALLSVGSLINTYTGRLRTAIIFLLGGALAEIPFSIIVKYGAENYGGGSSGGIYALIAVFLVCWLRFGQENKIKWYRPDLIVTVLFFIFANDNESSFLTHVFGFTAGIIIGTVMIMTGKIQCVADHDEIL